MRLAAAVVGFCVLAGCGYLKAGTDDPENWTRAFGTSKPSDVVILHSLYWRAPHFTTEFAYFFQLAANEELRRQLFMQNAMRQLPGTEVATARANLFGEVPAWFVDGELTRYDAWVRKDAPDNFIVFVDRHSGAMFIANWQV